MSSVNPKKLKVLELKRELEKRDITVSKSMKKADLVALLVSAIESEMGQEKDFSSSEAMDDSVASGTEGIQDSVTSGNEGVQEAEDSIGIAQTEKVPGESGNGDAASLDDKDLAMDVENEQPPTLQPESVVTESTENNEACQKPDHAVSDNKSAETEDKSEEIAMIKDSVSDSLDETTSKNAVDVDEKDDAVPLKAEEKTSEIDQSAAEETGDSNKPDTANADAHQTVETSNDHKKSGEKTNHQDSSRKRRHGDKTDRQNVWEDRYAPPEEEPEEEFDDSLVVLDLYNSDLNFKISKDRLSGQPLTMEGFAYLWAGARATYGVKEGKICFECKILEEDAVKHLASDEPHPHVVRVGWSTDYSSMQLGEAPLSYGYGGTGKFSADCKFSDYGEIFREGDVIGCYVDFSSENGVQFTYTKNGESLGVAITEEKKKLQDKPLFPHVLCKNTSIELNFGQRETPLFPDPAELQDYVYISSVQASERVRAVKAPQSKKECEVLMMCGLPGAGKSYYCRQKMTEEPDKKYNVLGTNAIMEKMRIMGVARKKNYAGRWELLIDNATQCLNRLLQVACRKRRNYILDQTNVYASAQRRKMRPFEGFQRKAIVIVPTEEEYKMRFEKRTDDEGKEVPEMAILGMKANFTLPEKGNLFDEVIFTELAREEAEKLIEKYREEGRKHGPPPEKRFRGGGGENRNRNRDGGWRRGRGFRGPPQFVNDAPWGRFGGGPMGYGRGGFGPGGFGRGGGFGGRQPGYGARGRDFGRGGKRDNYSRKPEHGGGRNKGGWTDHGGRGGRGGYGGYNRQNQGRGGFRNTGGSNFQPRQNLPNQNNRMSQNSQSVAPQSAQSYTYGHHPHYNTQNTSGFNTGGYNQQQQQQQPTPQQGVGTMAQQGQTQQHGYQQTYGQQDYSQQWAQYYQQQAQAQQYQNYYANYQQQYYNQQSAQQAPRQ